MPCNWFHVPDGSVNTYPSGDNSSRDASFTTTADDSAVLDAAATVIKGIHVGSSHAAGELEIRVHDSTTVIRRIDVPGTSGTNMSANENLIPFTVFGPWCAFLNVVGATDLYIQFEAANVWQS